MAVVLKLALLLAMTHMEGMDLPASHLWPPSGPLPTIEVRWRTVLVCTGSIESSQIL